MSDQVTDLRSTVAALRRRSRVLAATAVVGLAAGVAYVLVQPPPLTSTTLVLLPTPALADSSSTDVATQVRIALSATILEQAGEAVEPALPARSVEKMVEVSAPTNQLIEIDATSTRAAQAQTLSQAVADAYVAYVSETAQAATSAALADLQTRAEDLQAQITQLQDQITPTTKRQQEVDPDSADGRREAQLLAGLRTEQADLSLQLDKVKDKIATSAPVGVVREHRDFGHPAGDRGHGSLHLAATADLGAPRCPGLHHAGGRRPARDSTSRPAGAASRRDRRRGRQPGAGGGAEQAADGRWRVGRRCSRRTRRPPSSRGRSARSCVVWCPRTARGNLVPPGRWTTRSR